MTKYWFKPKRFGYGFMPVTIQGWIATLILLAVAGISVYVNDMGAATITYKQGLRFLLDLILIIGISFFFFEKKLDGDLKWRWG